MANINLTEKETKLLIACLANMTRDIADSVEWSKVAVDVGYKDGKNARVMFSRLRASKLGGNPGKPRAAEGDATGTGIKKASGGGCQSQGRKRKRTAAATTDAVAIKAEEEAGSAPEEAEVDEEAPEEEEGHQAYPGAFTSINRPADADEDVA